VPVALAVVACALAGCSSQAAPDSAPVADEAAQDDPDAPDDSDDAAPTRRTPPRGTPAAPVPRGTVTLAFGGDVHTEGVLADLPGRPRTTLGPLSAELRAADVAMVNLEAALTTTGRPTDKEIEDPGNRFWFRTPPETLDLLDRSGVDVVSVANNHGADYGLRGLRDTLRIARDAPIGVIGAGRDHVGAFRPFRTEVRGLGVSVLAADASFREGADDIWAAVPGSGPGLATARLPNVRPITGAVAAADARGDVVVVYLHWGDEGETCPTGEQQRLAQALADAGADVVVGTHAHELQGAGMLDDTYVSYGLGNFAWYNGFNPETGVLRLVVRDGVVVKDRLVPGRTPPDGGVPEPVTGPAAQAAVADWRDLRACTRLAPAPDGPTTSRPDGPAPTPSRPALPAYSGTVSVLTPEVRRRMTSSHRAGCPVPLADLRYLRVSYVDFAGRPRRGELVVHQDVAKGVVQVFRRLYDARFPIQRMRLVDAYGGDDDRSMAANNTSAYNCRTIAGTTAYSDHAYGRAVDINPVQNPYVIGDDVRPPAARRYLGEDRTGPGRAAPGVIREGDVVTRAFAAIGWRWGGDFSEPDYQHFDGP
jgi:poly-gamma-glutamate capsule biosynthesis protein CapA/YwtB (metallophosphatase superfamily)